MDQQLQHSRSDLHGHSGFRPIIHARPVLSFLLFRTQFYKRFSIGTTILPVDWFVSQNLNSFLLSISTHNCSIENRKGTKKISIHVDFNQDGIKIVTQLSLHHVKGAILQVISILTAPYRILPILQHFDVSKNREFPRPRYLRSDLQASIFPLYLFLTLTLTLQ